MCSEASPPRLSFSHDLGQSDVLPVGHNQLLPRRDMSLLDLNCDFEFSISSSSFNDESSSADELFSHGVILPMQPKERVDDVPKRIYNINSEARHSASLPPLPSPPTNESQKKESVMKEGMDVSLDNLEQKPPQSKYFWGFKRSSSCNQDSKKGLLCSLPLLSRSNSTGSAPNPKKPIFRDARKNNSSHKQSSSNISMSKSSSCSSSSSSSSSNPYAMLLPRPPSKKGYNGSSYYGNGSGRISPVLNVPSPYISKGTAKLFCLGSFLHPPGKDKKGKK